MKKLLLGFIAIVLLTFVGCDKDDDSSSSSSSEEKDTDSGDGTTGDSSIKYGEGLTDGDGNTYKTVIIGEQEWMAENLRTTKYNDGTSIPNVTDGSQWDYLSTGAWSHYNNDNQYDTIYGKLYNWYAVETGKLCPTGWHVPTDAEWTELNDYLAANGYSGTEGIALKSTSGWGSGGNGTDDYGWNALPGRYRYYDGDFDGCCDYGLEIVITGNWWSSSQYSTGNAWGRYLDDYSQSSCTLDLSLIHI